MLLTIAASLALQLPLPASSKPLASHPVGTVEGQVLPEVVLPTVDGQDTVSLGQYEGKPLLLLQFASW